MHSFIFQIDSSPISETEFINAYTIEYGYNVDIDYAYNLDKCDQREHAIRVLAEVVLPKGMFTLNPDLSLTYSDDINIWSKEYFNNIMYITKSLTPDNILNKDGKMRELKHIIYDPLDTACLFDCGNGLVDYSASLMHLISTLKRDDKLYIGAVLGYHF